MTHLGGFDAPVLAAAADGVEIEIAPLAYDHQRAAAKMRARRGVALSPLRLFWAGAVPVG